MTKQKRIRITIVVLIVLGIVVLGMVVRNGQEQGQYYEQMLAEKGLTGH
jgi:hypothetical protein